MFFVVLHRALEIKIHLLKTNQLSQVLNLAENRQSEKCLVKFHHFQIAKDKYNLSDHVLRLMYFSVSYLHNRHKSIFLPVILSFFSTFQDFHICFLLHGCTDSNAYSANRFNYRFSDCCLADCKGLSCLCRTTYITIWKYKALAWSSTLLSMHSFPLEDRRIYSQFLLTVQHR